MRTLLSFAIILFIFSNSSCEDCMGKRVTKKEDCIDLTIEEGKKYCCYTEVGFKEKGNSDNSFVCDSFSDEDLANKEELKTKNYVDIDCDLSGSSEGANSGNSGGEKEKERKRDSNSSSKLIYLSKAIFILLLLVL